MDSSTSVGVTADRITISDWMLALIGLLFTVIGMLILPRDFKVGLSCLVFFGPCLAWAVSVILRKRRHRRQQPLQASVTGGAPIRPSRWRLGLLGGGLLGVGTTLAVLHAGQGWVMFACALVMATAGGLTLLGVLTGWVSRAYMQFEPDGLRIGGFGGCAFIPWSAMQDLGRGELHGNAAVMLRVDASAVVAEPPAYWPRLQRSMASARALAGADFVILSGHYGVDAPVLLATIDHYLSNPEDRQELQAPLRLGH